MDAIIALTEPEITPINPYTMAPSSWMELCSWTMVSFILVILMARRRKVRSGFRPARTSTAMASQLRQAA